MLSTKPYAVASSNTVEKADQESQSQVLICRNDELNERTILIYIYVRVVALELRDMGCKPVVEVNDDGFLSSLCGSTGRSHLREVQ